MMGSENLEIEETQESNSKEELESVVLDDPLQTLSFHSYSDYRSVMSSATDTLHPLSPPSDPLLSAVDKYPPNNNNGFGGSFSLLDNLYLEPPSYAEAVFTPFGEHGDPLNNGNDAGLEASVGRLTLSPPSSHHLIPSSSSSSEILRISVTNPQKELETGSSLVPGSSTYVTYLITTKTNLPEYGGSEFSVRRRFRDVVTLADRLAESYRGFFIPPRPDKSVVESQVMQKQEFVDQRRVALERYLQRLAAHPVIRRSEELRLFLKAFGKFPLLPVTDVASRMLDGAVKLPKQLLSESMSAISAHEVAQPAKGGRDLLRIFKELRQSVTNDWGTSRPPLVEEDKEFLEKKDKVLDLEQQLSNASQQAESLVKAQQDIGETMGELGLAFIKLAKFETDTAMLNTQKVRAADIRRVATASVKASRFYRESNAQIVKYLDKLHEHLGLMQAVHSAFSDRSSALLTVQTLMSEVSSMTLKAEKLEAASSRVFADKTKGRKLEELNETIRATEEAKICAINQYERIKENNRSEIERLDQERHDDFFSMLKGFVINQAGYSEKIAGVWTQVAEETRIYSREAS